MGENRITPKCLINFQLRYFRWGLSRKEVHLIIKTCWVDIENIDNSVEFNVQSVYISSRHGFGAMPAIYHSWMSVEILL